MPGFSDSFKSWFGLGSTRSVENDSGNTRKIVFRDAICKETMKSILMRFEHRNPDSWVLTSTVPLKSNNMGMDFNHIEEISGVFGTDPGYRGCPYCKSWGYVLCICGALCCWEFKNGKPVPKRFTCLSCGLKGRLKKPIKQMDTSRGG